MAITLYADHSWIGVAAWWVPIAEAARSGSVHLSIGGSTPLLSDGVSIPVFEPNPKLLSASYSFCFPSCWAIMIVPTFDDSATICRADIASTGWGSWSENVRSLTWMWSGTLNTVSGPTNPASIAADTVTSLNTEPAW